MSLQHVFIIPDGNRRWAKANNLPLETGYLKGVEKIGDVASWCKDFSIPMLSMWGFSTENFSRSESERALLFSLFESKADELLRGRQYEKYDVRLRFVGDLSKFPESLAGKFRRLEELTREKTKYAFNIFMGYGGRDELVNAVKSIAHKVREGELAESAITPETVETGLYTSGIRDPDLIIRTSGEHRLSGALPWQSVYSELYFTDVCWPAFSRADFQKAIDDYNLRERRFGL